MLKNILDFKSRGSQVMHKNNSEISISEFFPSETKTRIESVRFQNSVFNRQVK